MSKLSLLVCLTLALMPLAHALELKTERYTLGNGMTVILHEDPSTPKVTVNFLVKVGSKDEPDRRSGFAHLFEHLMFMGTKRVPQGEYDKIIESYGGDNNAFTAPDMTLYYSSAPAKALPTLLWLEADRLEALGENIDQKKLDLQRNVVLNERRQTTEDTPYGEAEEAINQLIYPETHPYYRGTIGSPTDLNAATVEDVKAFFATYYVPNNISLLVAGNFKSREVKPLIEKLFASLPRKNDTLRKTLPPQPSLGTKRATYVDRVSDPKLYMVWRVSAQGSDAFNKLDVATTAIQTRLNEALLDEGIAVDASISVSGGILGSTVYLTAVPSEGVTLIVLERRVDAVLNQFFKGGMTSAELKTSVAATESGIYSRLQDIVERAIQMNVDSYYYADPNYTLRSLEAYKRFTPQSVVGAAQQYLKFDNRLIMSVMPQSKGNPTARDNRPSNAADAAFAFPQALDFKLSNGIAVTYWQSGQFPLSFVSVVSNQGSGSEGAGGSARLLANLLDKGSKTPNFERTLQALGASLSSSADPKQTVITLSTLSSNLEPATALLAEAVTTPLISNDEFKNEQGRLAQEVDSLPDDARLLSLQVAYTVYYGSNHPLGRFLTAGQVNKLTLADVRKRQQETINPANLRIFMAGDQPSAKAKAILDRTFGTWKAAPKPLPSLRYTPPTSGPARLIFVEREGSPQTMIRIFTPLEVGLTSPEALRFTTLATVLGGTFTSRLNANLREDKGYTYGVSAGYILELSFGILNTRTSVQVADTGNSIKEIIKELTGIGSGISPEETQKALQTQVADTLASFSSAGLLVSTSANLAAGGRTLANLQRDYATLRTLTTDDINARAAKSVALNNAVWVIVGDSKTVLPQLEGLDLPKLEMFTVPK